MAKVFFQGMNPQLFRAIFIGYLYEIAQKHEVVLTVEELDPYTERLLKDKKIFPGLQNIVFIEQPFGGNIFLKHYRMYKLLRKSMSDFNPDVVITHTDMWPGDMWALRLAKEMGAVGVAMQAGFKIANGRKLYTRSSLMNIYTKFPVFLPFSIRLFLAKAKKHIAHIVYYWVLPISICKKPFFGKTSFIFWDESSGLRDAQYSTVFSKRDYDLCVQDGVSPERLLTVGHPLEHASTRAFFEHAYFTKNNRQRNGKIVTVMWPAEAIAFAQEGHLLIPKEAMMQRRAKVVQLLVEELPGWQIFIKPHPREEHFSSLQRAFAQYKDRVSVVEPSEPADHYIDISDVIVGMPPPSTTLFSAQKQKPERIILSLNTTKEFLGDAYKNFPGIEYIDTEEQLVNVLDRIQKGEYKKEAAPQEKFDFMDAGQLVEYVYEKRLY